MGFKMTKLQFGTYTIYLISLIICTYKTVYLINGNYDNPQTQIILINLINMFRNYNLIIT